MNHYALLLPHVPNRYATLSETDFMDTMKDYIAWVEELTKDGTFVGGHKLADEPGKLLVAAEGGVELHDGPFAEMTEVLGGIMVIKAQDYDDAVRIAKTNPHLVHNSRIEIRRIQDS